MISALIHPDGRLTPLSGNLSTDPTSVAALAHAVHAAGHELLIRVGTAPLQWITLRGVQHSLTLLTVQQGLLVLEHEHEVTLEAIQAKVAAVLTQLTATASPAPVASPVTAPFSLSDALHATAP